MNLVLVKLFIMEMFAQLWTKTINIVLDTTD